MRVVSDAIEQSHGQTFGLEDLAPFSEGQVRIDDHALTLVSLTQRLEEQICGVLADRHVAQLVNDDQIDCCEAPQVAM